MISKPDVCLVDLEEDDHFLILASDGVWEFMDNQEAVDIVSACSDDEVACSKVPHNPAVLSTHPVTF